MSERKDIHLLRKEAEKFRAFLFSKDALSFLFFLLLSAAFWFAHASDKEQEKKISVPVRYVDIPKNIAITNELVTEIKVDIKEQGGKLFSFTKEDIPPILVNLSKLDLSIERMLLSSDEIAKLLRNRIQEPKKIVSYSPDSILIKYKKLNSKVVPVKLNANFELSQQYILSQEIQIIPKEITVYGEANSLKELNFVQTKNISETDIKKNSLIKCELTPIEGLSFSTDMVEAEVLVEMFTEKKVVLPVQFKNNPDKFILTAFPPQVTVTYNIAASAYNTPEDCVEIIVDYKTIKNSKKERHQPIAIPKSDKIFNIKMEPKDIQFILKERSKE